MTERASEQYVVDIDGDLFGPFESIDHAKSWLEASGYGDVDGGEDDTIHIYIYPLFVPVWGEA